MLQSWKCYENQSKLFLEIKEESSNSLILSLHLQMLEVLPILQILGLFDTAKLVCIHLVLPVQDCLMNWKVML